MWHKGTNPFFALFSPTFHFQCRKGVTLKLGCAWALEGRVSLTGCWQCFTTRHSLTLPIFQASCTASSEPNAMGLKFYMSPWGKWSLQGKVLRSTTVLHHPASVLRYRLCPAGSKHQQSNLSPCLQKDSHIPGLCGLTSLCGHVSTGGWRWGQTRALILGSLPLRADPRLIGVDGNILTNVHELWFRSFYIHRGMTHSGKVKITPI